jgi:HEPN domain-containing protein/predicted nucleotidyltransferase
MEKGSCDPRALKVAEMVHRRENPHATILFGSRARGDHEDHRSDIDIMLVIPETPATDYKEAIDEWAQQVARDIYHHQVPVQLTWYRRAEFDENLRNINDVATRALLDGVLMSENPEQFHSRYSGGEQMGPEYKWTDFNNWLEHAEGHLEAFEMLDDARVRDFLLGEQAQAALEHAMKAITAGHGGIYRDTHNLGHLLGRVRRIDSELQSFTLSIYPDIYSIYSAYAGNEGYSAERQQPRLTEVDDYRERTVNDVEVLLERARQLGPSMYP